MLQIKGIYQQYQQQFLAKFYRCVNRLKLNISQCLLCYQQGKSHPLLCDYCLEALTKFNYQQVQGDLLNWPAINKHLPKVAFDRLICAASYQWPVSDWIMQLKYRQQSHLGDLLGYLLAIELAQANTADQQPIDLVLSIPIHPKRWQQRGYNQAHLIAHYFCGYAGLLYCPEILIKSKYSESQVGQTGAQRRKNLAASFQIAHVELIVGKHILLVDDVVTTGATASVVTKLLKDAGAKSVTLATVAIALVD